MLLVYFAARDQNRSLGNNRDANWPPKIKMREIFLELELLLSTVKVFISPRTHIFYVAYQNTIMLEISAKCGKASENAQVSRNMRENWHLRNKI